MRHSTWIIRVCAIAASFSGFAFSSAAPNARYWVWQRDEPLDDRELAELTAQNVDTIYWHVGELENIGTTWRWKTRFSFPRSGGDRIHFVPVVRLVSRERQPFSDASTTALVASLSSVTAKHPELQLDCDTPDRLLEDYAAALKRIHGLVSRLSLAALPHWSRADHLKVLEPAVDEFLPMLYDFEVEPMLKNEAPLPLLSPEKISKLIDSWRACGKPWRAGLPVFARLSVYDANQKLRGQIRNWNWDELCFNRNLQVASHGEFGTTILRANKPTFVANTTVNSGEKIIVREVDRAALQNAMTAASRAGAQGVVFFRLPDSTAASGWSLRQLGHLQARPQLLLRKAADSETLELSNTGDGDLPPRFPESDQDEGGYVLEIDFESPILREAERGDFASLVAFAGDKPARVPFATRLRFRFAQLRAQESLRTGLIQLAPGANFRQARYRFLNSGDNLWKPLE